MWFGGNGIASATRNRRHIELVLKDRCFEWNCEATPEISNYEALSIDTEAFTSRFKNVCIHKIKLFLANVNPLLYYDEYRGASPKWRKSEIFAAPNEL
jgi:hypothetical protein